MKYIIALFFVVSAGVAQATESSQNTAIASACKAMPEARERAIEYHAIGYVQKGTSVVAVSGSCGVAGCTQKFLVITRFSKNSVNPQMRSIVGMVHKPPAGDITCELVELN